MTIQHTDLQGTGDFLIEDNGTVFKIARNSDGTVKKINGIPEKTRHTGYTSINVEGLVYIDLTGDGIVDINSEYPGMDVKAANILKAGGHFIYNKNDNTEILGVTV